MAITKLELTGGGTPFDPANPQTFPEGFSTFEDSVQTELDGKVDSAGDETINGIKTFAASPIVPTPTTSSQAATKQYVDDNAGTGGTFPTYGAISIVETAEGVWSADVPARTEGENPCVFVGWSDPADVTNGITTPANINDTDRWVQVSAP